MPHGQRQGRNQETTVTPLMRQTNLTPLSAMGRRLPLVSWRLEGWEQTRALGGGMAVQEHSLTRRTGACALLDGDGVSTTQLFQNGACATASLAGRRGENMMRVVQDCRFTVLSLCDSARRQE